MWNRKKLATVIAVALSTGTVAVMACGPFFPLQVLDDRAQALASPPGNSFAFEATHWITPADALKAYERDNNPYGEPVTPDKPDQASLPAAQWTALQAMRQADSDAAAYALGSALPPALRLYTTGAVDLKAAQRCTTEAQGCVDESQALAAQRFQAVLDLPAEQGAARSVWAAYALGRLHAERGEQSAAAQAFNQARTLALAGASDPWGLAVSSYGEEARLYLVNGQQRCDYTDFTNGTECPNGITPANLQRAIALYAEQAARGSDIGLQSLRILAEWLLSDGDTAASVIDDPLSQRLLVAYAIGRASDVLGENADTPADYTSNAVLKTLVEAIRKKEIQHVQGADRLAALAYRVGDYSMAQALVDKQSSALAGWVRAKLALRQGNTPAAAQAYAQASQSFPTLDNSVEPVVGAQIKGEQGVLTLSRGDYVQALDQFYVAAQIAAGGSEYSGGDYYGDMAYVAERVLTVDELKAYVDQHVPASAVPATPAGFKDFSPQEFSAWSTQNAYPRFTQGDRLRSLLARRLVREGRIQQALPYFPEDSDPRNVDTSYDQTTEKPYLVTATARGWAKAYGAALDDAQHAWRDTTRARAWYAAATLARQHGMEIMGYEQAPDFAEFGGAYTYGAGRYSYPRNGADGKPLPRDTAEQRAVSDLPGPLVTDGERQRYAATEPQPQRFHYRYVAVEHALKAADNVPERSQAFAAVLCQATHFVQNDQERAEKVYLRYVKEGAAVAFAEDFGHQCVEPDFDAAARFPYVHAWRDARSWAHPYRYAVIAVLVLGCAGLIAWRVRRRKV
ncbi:hypothetical protein [Pseudomonas sp. RIT-To-2]|uniref:hypothetical protein n=1 Tax=Pseudomonas sp. RIT-To-2 TaxID=3462541 RepID=UPI0024136CB4